MVARVGLCYLAWHNDAGQLDELEVPAQVGAAGHRGAREYRRHLGGSTVRFNSNSSQSAPQATARDVSFMTLSTTGKGH